MIEKNMSGHLQAKSYLVHMLCVCALHPLVSLMFILETCQVFAFTGEMPR